MVAKVKRTTYLLLVSGFALQTCIDSTQAVTAAHSVVDAQDDRHLSSNLTSRAYRISGPTEERMDPIPPSTIKALLARLDQLPFAEPADKLWLQASIAEMFNKDPTLVDSDHPMDFAAAEVLFEDQNPALSKEIVEDLQSHLLDIWIEQGKSPLEVFMYCGLGNENKGIFRQQGFPKWVEYVLRLSNKDKSEWIPALVDELRQACKHTDDNLKAKLNELINDPESKSESKSIAFTLLGALPR